MKKIDKFLFNYFKLNEDQIDNIDIVVAELLYDDICNGNINRVKKLMKKYAKKCLLEADEGFGWDHDMDLWTGDYRPSEVN